MHRILHPPSLPPLHLHSVHIYRLIFCTTNKPFYEKIRLDLGYILSCAFTCDIHTVYGSTFFTYYDFFAEGNVFLTEIYHQDLKIDIVMHCYEFQMFNFPNILTEKKNIYYK